MAKKKASESTELFPVEGNGEMITDDYAKELLGAAGQDVGNQLFLKFSKAGDWVFGSDDDEIGADDIVAINPASFVAGWQGWEDGTPIDGPVVPYGKRSELPPKHSLEEISPGEMNGWSPMVGCRMRLKKEEINLVYNTTSKGGKDFIRDLVKVVAIGMMEHRESPVALVTLKGGSYMHPNKQYGKILTPGFTLVGWADGNGKQNKKLKLAA